MGDVSSGKINPIQGTDAVPAESKPDVSRRTSTPGNTKASKPAPAPTPINYPSSPSGFPPHGRYAPPPSSMNMANMAYALRGHQSTGSPFEQQHHMHHYPATHTQGMIYPMQSMGHYPGQPPAGAVPYGIPYAPNFSPYAMPQHPGAAQHGGHYPPFVSSPSMQNMAGHSPSYGPGYYHPGYSVSYGPGTLPVAAPIRQSSRQGSASASRGSSSTSPSKRDADRQAVEEYDVSKTIVDGSNPMKLAAGSNASETTSLPPSSPNPPRGPPRKPKQSGHALWVGNLPPGASVIDLKDHFSQDATDDIESVFLISKSNCAFVNYKSAPACADALARFHDSRFHGVRLVCRLRKGFTAPGSGPGSGSIGVGGLGSRLRTEETPDPPSGGEAIATETETGPGPLPLSQDGNAGSIDRYFIVKSLTVDDLELSKQSGIWATQTHNETSLNQAFETTEHVYLIFSANKSGEYFGYARMLSPISDDEDLVLEMPTRPEPAPGSIPAPEEPEMTLTPATSNAPKGRIIDDSARGTIFWEVESLEDETDDTRSERSVDGFCLEDGDEVQSFGKPFRIQWLSTERVPFHRTRGLRNPWNANREVKIARDGTEIEPTVGRKLIQLFHLPSHS